MLLPLSLRRIAAAFAIAFVLLTAAFGWAIYAATRHALAAELDARLAGETSAIVAGLASPADVAGRIAQREGRRSTAGLGYALYAPDGRRLAGRLDMARPAVGLPAPGLSNVEFNDGEEGRDSGRALVTALPGGPILAVVADGEPIEQLDALLARIFALAFGAAIVAGTAGGWALTAVVRRRIDGIGAAAEAIFEGDMTRRMPTDGSGGAFDRQSAALNRMLDRIAELMANLRAVSGDIAHDLRTPLARLRNRLDSALREPRAECARREIEAAIGEADAVLDLFAALLRISEVEAGARRAAFTRLDIAQLAHEVVETFAPALEDGGRWLRFGANGRVFVFGDRELLTQMLVNLVENAARHTPVGTVVQVNVEARGDMVALSVADDGVGTPLEPAALVRRFARGESSRSTAGHGLGLALVHAIVRLHDGELTFTDNAPGLCVTATLKRSRS